MDQQATGFVVATRAALAQLSALAVQYSFSVVGAVLLLIVGWLAAGLLSRWAHDGLGRIRSFDATLAQFFANVIRYAILIIVIVMVLGQFGVQTASVLAALGAVGLAVGLALQGTLQNIAAGIMLLVLRPLRVGEYIETPSVSGTVQDIGLFATELKTYDGLYRLTPNSLLWNVPVTNHSRLPTRMHDLKLHVADQDAIERAMQMLLNLAQTDERILKQPAPTAFVTDLTDTGAVISLRYWANTGTWWAVSRDITKQAKEMFHSAGITVRTA